MIKSGVTPTFVSFAFGQYHTLHTGCQSLITHYTVTGMCHGMHTCILYVQLTEAALAETDNIQGDDGDIKNCVIWPVAGGVRHTSIVSLEDSP